MQQRLMNRRQSSHVTAANQKRPSPVPVRYLTSATEGEDLQQPAAASLGLSPTKLSRA